jgi:DNA-binding response OmpR family regulator
MDRLISVIDDDPDVLEIVALHLRTRGFNVDEFTDADSFLESLNTRIPDLIILDLKLPDADGFEICKSLKKSRKYSHIPIIMLTGKSEEENRVFGLELGADDYITKPFSVRELIARVNVVLRRIDTKSETNIIEIGNILKIDPKKYRVTVEGKEISLTATEYRILSMLSEKKGWVFTRKQILDKLWGADKAVTDRTVDVHIKNLKKKLGKARKFLKHVTGIGYKLDE